LFVLGGLQGFIGWWMVSSGLVDRVDVSQYRLATHLTLACIIFAYTLWLARSLVSHTNEIVTSTLAKFAPWVVFAVLLQIFLGALVAGLDAGLAYNEWPMMDGAIIPNDLWVQTPFWINAFENPKTVQFIHRMSAYALLACNPIASSASGLGAISPRWRDRCSGLCNCALARCDVREKLRQTQV